MVKSENNLVAAGGGKIRIIGKSAKARRVGKIGTVAAIGRGGKIRERSRGGRGVGKIDRNVKSVGGSARSV